MPRVKQVSPAMTAREAQLVERIVWRELYRLGAVSTDIEDPFEAEAGKPLADSVKRRRIAQLANARDKIDRALVAIEEPVIRAVSAVQTDAPENGDALTSLDVAAENPDDACDRCGHRRGDHNGGRPLTKPYACQICACFRFEESRR